MFGTLSITRGFGQDEPVLDVYRNEVGSLYTITLYL